MKPPHHEGSSRLGAALVKSAVIGAILAAPVFASGLGCSGATPRSSLPATRPSAMASSSWTTPSAPGASWVLWPKWSWRSRAEIETERGTLYVGEGGQRWLVSAGTPRSAMPAPETLTGVLRGEQGYLFISDSGRVFGADEPLGRLVAYGSTRVAKKAASGRSHFVAILANELRVSQDGSAWHRAVAPQRDELVDVVMSGAGRGLALSVSGQLLATTNDGLEFRPLPATPRRVLRLARHGEQLFALSEQIWNERYKYYELEGSELSQEREGAVFAALPLKQLGSTPERAALSTSSAWLAFREQPGPDGVSTYWETSLAPFGQPPTYQRLPNMDDHCWLLPEPFAKLSFLAECGTGTRQLRLMYRPVRGGNFADLSLEGLSSRDFGDGYGEVLHRLSDTSFLVGLPCSTRGGPRLVTTDPPSSTALGEDPCREHQAFTRDEPELLSVARSPAGWTVHRWREQKPELLGTLPTVAVPAPFRTVPNDAGASVPPPASTRATGITTVEKGIMLVVLRASASAALLRSQDGGATFVQRTLPVSAGARLRMVGRRGFLIDASSRGYESNDAGETWHRAEVPASLETLDLDCVAAGCMTSFGFRVGWDLP